MGARVVFVGVALIVLVPLFALVGLGSSQFLGCSGGGSSGPVSGCEIFGLSLNWFVSLATLAFIASFFSVPVGVVVLLCGFSLLIYEGRRRASTVRHL